jgi:hypothetical protein
MAHTVELTIDKLRSKKHLSISIESLELTTETVVDGINSRQFENFLQLAS